MVARQPGLRIEYLELVTIVQLSVTFAKSLPQFAAGIRYVTFIYLIYQVWHSPIAVGAAIGIPSLAVAVLSPLGGMLADSYRRTRIILLAYGVQIVGLASVLLLTALRQSSPIWIVISIYILFFIIQGMDVLVGPSFTTLMTDLVSARDLVRWQAWVNVLGTAGWLVGLVFSGIFVERMGPAMMLGFIILIVGMSMASTVAIKESPKPRVGQSGDRSHGSWLNWRGTSQAWSAIRRDPFLFSFLVVVTVSNIPHNMFLALPFFFSQQVHAGYAGFSTVEAALMTGTTLAGLWFTRKHQTHHVGKLLSLAFFLQTGVTGILSIGGLRSSIAAVVIGMAVYGATDALFNPAYAYLSVTAPKANRGQVLGLFNGIAVLLNPVMSILTGWLLTNLSMGVLVGALTIVFGVIAMGILLVPALARKI